MRSFLDTNVLVCLFDDADQAKQSVARSLFQERAVDSVISTQVLIELHAVLTRKLGRTRAEAARAIDAFDIEVLATDESLVRSAANTAAMHELSIFDALVVEAAAAAGCDELLTEDLDSGSVLRGVRIVNPFALT